MYGLILNINYNTLQKFEEESKLQGRLVLIRDKLQVSKNNVADLLMYPHFA
jgi:hypothetical protein